VYHVCCWKYLYCPFLIVASVFSNIYSKWFA
jgi:hypothetical protein